MDYRTYLKHYGVLGMHWGVRKKEPPSSKRGKAVKLTNKKPSVEDAREFNRKILKKNPNANDIDWDKFAEKPTQKKKLTPKKKTLSEIEQEKRRKLIRNIAIGVGAGVLIGAATLYYLDNKEFIDRKVGEILESAGLKKVDKLTKPDNSPLLSNDLQKAYKGLMRHNVTTEEDAKFTNFIATWIKKDLERVKPLDDSDIAAMGAEDIFLKAGQEITRVKRTNGTAIRDFSYMCFDKDDVNRYQAVLPAMWRERRQIKDRGYTMSLEALDTIKIAPLKKQFDIYVDMLVEKQGRTNAPATRDQCVQLAKQHFNGFASALINDGPDRDDFIKRVKALGYDAIIDGNDSKKLSRSPMILLNSSKVKVNKVEPITKEIIQKAVEGLMLMEDENLDSVKGLIEGRSSYEQSMIKNAVANYFNTVDEMAAA